MCRKFELTDTNRSFSWTRSHFCIPPHNSHTRRWSMYCNSSCGDRMDVEMTFDRIIKYDFHGKLSAIMTSATSYIASMCVYYLISKSCVCVCHVHFRRRCCRRDCAVACGSCGCIFTMCVCLALHHFEFYMLLVWDTAERKNLNTSRNRSQTNMRWIISADGVSVLTAIQLVDGSYGLCSRSTGKMRCSKAISWKLRSYWVRNFLFNQQISDPNNKWTICVYHTDLLCIELAFKTGSNSLYNPIGHF